MSFLTYGLDHRDQLLTATAQHLALVALTLLASIAIAALVTAFIRRAPKIGEYIQSTLAVLYSIPSLALFALLIPLLGIGRATALVVLVAYNQFLLVRNFNAGLDAVDPGLTAAAHSLGMTSWQTFRHIQLPLATPIFIAGIRLATVSTIGIATIAAVIDAGGLGTLLFEGLRSHNLNKLLWGTLLAATLAIGTNAALTTLESRSGKESG